MRDSICNDCAERTRCDMAEIGRSPLAISTCYCYKKGNPTNADRIRTMSDEELAKYFSSIAECDHCQNELDRECCVNEDVCINRWLEWLKSEA